VLLIAFWALFPGAGHRFNELPKLADKNKTWHPLWVLAELKGRLKRITWLLQKDGLVSGVIHRQPLAEPFPALGTGRAIGFTEKSHRWATNTATCAG